MASSDWVIRVVGILRTADDMSPPRTDSRSSRNIDHSAVLVLDVFVACKLSIVHVLDGVVAVWGPYTFELALISAVDANLLEDGVAEACAYEACDECSAEELHV